MIQTPADLDVLVPNFKRRLSGVTATIVRLVPLQAQSMQLAAVGGGMPDHVPQISLWSLLTLPRRKTRVWHARRNTEMLAGLVLKHVLRKRLRLVFTSASQRIHTGYTKWLIDRMDHVIATSARTAAYLSVPHDVILHGIDTDQFRPGDRAALRAQLDLPDGPLIGCFGRIRAQKGTGDFVEAMLRVLPDHPNAHAIIMGRATEQHLTYERGLKTRIAEAGLSDRIRFLPEVPVSDIAAYYAALDLFVAPQRWEGFGLTPLEAMACGVPVIATTVGAFPELIVPGETVALITPEDVTAMADAIETALAAPDQLSRQGQAARAHVEARFRIEDEAEAIMAIYRRLLSP